MPEKTSVNEHSASTDCYLLDGSIVRKNLMTRRGYMPYCGAEKCSREMPRTTFDGKQFFCACGWRSEFPEDFIRQYLRHWQEVERRYVDGADFAFRQQLGL